MIRLSFCHLLFAVGIIFPQAYLHAAERNIVVFVTDDESPTLGCYGDTSAVTPSIDALAAEGHEFDVNVLEVRTCFRRPESCYLVSEVH